MTRKLVTGVDRLLGRLHDILQQIGTEDTTALAGIIDQLLADEVGDDLYRLLKEAFDRFDRRPR